MCFSPHLKSVGIKVELFVYLHHVTYSLTIIIIGVHVLGIVGSAMHLLEYIFAHIHSRVSIHACTHTDTHSKKILTKIHNCTTESRTLMYRVLFILSLVELRRMH